MSGASRFLFDAFSAVSLWGIAVFGAWLPKRLQSSSSPTSSRIYSLGNMLSAGVMLSAGFVHLLGAAIRDLGHIRYPVAPLLCALGYLVTLCADTVVDILMPGAGDGHHAKGNGGCDHHVLDIANALSNAPPSPAFESEPPLGRGRRGPSPAPDLAGIRSGDIEDTDYQEALLLDVAGPRQRSLTAAGPPNSGSPLESSHAKHVSFTTAVFLVAALSLHSFLEGMALGAQAGVSKSEDIYIAIAAHKGLAAYALGSSVVDSNPTDKKFWSLILGFAMATPVGILVGYGLSEIGNSATGAGLSALASGTFLYVAMMEVIPREMESPDKKASKMGIMLLGFGLMSLLAIWA